jgi:hypothetical protein
MTIIFMRRGFNGKPWVQVQLPGFILRLNSTYIRYQLHVRWRGHWVGYEKRQPGH